MKYNIFISYSRKDKKVVETFCKSFDNAGITYWVDRTGIESGDAFRRVIVQAIEDCEILVFFASKHSNQSEWTEKEINTAVYYKKSIIPVRLDKSQYNKSVLFELAGLDFIDYTIPAIREKVAERLVDTIKKKVGSVETELTEIVASNEDNTSKHPKANTKAYFKKVVKIAVSIQITGLAVLVMISAYLLLNPNTITRYRLLSIEDALIICVLLAMIYCTYNIKKIRWCKWAFLLLDALGLFLLYAVCSKYTGIVDYSIQHTGYKKYNWAMMDVIHRTMYNVGKTRLGIASFYCAIIYIGSAYLLQTIEYQQNSLQNICSVPKK